MTSSEKEKLFLDIVQSHQTRVFRLCLGILCNRDEASDAVQEVWIQIWRNLERFRGESSVSTWIYRITVNTAILYNQRLKREEKKMTEAARTIAEVSKIDNTGRRENQMVSLYRMIAALPKEERVIVSLFLEGLAYEEISGIVGISVNYVGVKLNRIKRELADAVKE